MTQNERAIQAIREDEIQKAVAYLEMRMEKARHHAREPGMASEESNAYYDEARTWEHAAACLKNGEHRK